MFIQWNILIGFYPFFLVLGERDAKSTRANLAAPGVGQGQEEAGASVRSRSGLWPHSLGVSGSLAAWGGGPGTLVFFLATALNLLPCQCCTPILASFWFSCSGHPASTSSALPVFVTKTILPLAVLDCPAQGSAQIPSLIPVALARVSGTATERPGPRDGSLALSFRAMSSPLPPIFLVALKLLHREKLGLLPCYMGFKINFIFSFNSLKF